MQLNHSQRMTLTCIVEDPVPLADFDTREDLCILKRLEDHGLVEQHDGQVYATAAGRAEV